MTTKPTRRSIMTTIGGAAIALALVIAPATSASAAGSKSWNYNCTGMDGFSMQSYGLHTVGHYRNGTLIKSWNNSVSTWRSTVYTGAPGTGSIYASYALYNSSAACVDFA